MRATTDRSIASLFVGRFEPLAPSLAGSHLSEVAQFLRSEDEFVALQKPAHAFLARIFWNTVLTPVISAYRDVIARERELAEVEDRMTTIRNDLEQARTANNSTADTLLQYARDHDRWQLQIDARKSALNHAMSRLNALLAPVNQIQHVS